MSVSDDIHHGITERRKDEFGTRVYNFLRIQQIRFGLDNSLG